MPEAAKSNSESLKKLYHDMLLIRRFEERAGQLYGMGLIGGFCHLYIGQEAVVVGLMGAAKQGARRRYVRRITLWRPGEEEVALLTDLLDEALYPAVDLLAVYLTRWQVENVFQAITEVFELRHLIGCTPRATE